MAKRADAHLHLFENGFEGSFTNRPGVQIDEVACYASLAESYDVAAALIVGYAGDSWCKTNNDFLARVAPDHDWIKPAAFVDPCQPFTIDTLEQFRAQGFVGITMYVYEEDKVAGVKNVPDEIWSWLVGHKWLISVNSGGQNWLAWQGVLERHGELRVVLSHVGGPPRASEPLSAAQARGNLAEVLTLCSFPGPRIKLSGFYALSDPGYDYPHEAAWPYVQVLVEQVGCDRLLWASDFSPALDNLTLPQTFGLFAKMPFLTDADRQGIEGANLLSLLDEIG